MKKVITTILSVLMLISCLTVNVFAEDTEAQDSANPPAVQIISSDGSEGNPATHNTENTESMNLVISSTDENNQPETITVPLTKRTVADGDDSGFEWYISPDLEMFSQGGYLYFCKHIANKGEVFSIEYTDNNGQIKTIESNNIDVSKSTSSNIIRCTANVFDKTIVFAEYFENMLYARETYFEGSELKLSNNTILSIDKPTNVEINNNKRYALFYGKEYDSEESISDMRLTDSTPNIKLDKSGYSTINYSDNFFEFYFTRSSNDARISYEGQTLIFTSVLPSVGIYKSAEVSDDTYCNSYSEVNRSFYIHWDRNLVNTVSINSIKRFEQEYNVDVDYDVKTLADTNTMQINFHNNVDIKGGLDIDIQIFTLDGDDYNMPFYINYETLYIRRVNEVNGLPEYSNYGNTSFNGDVFVDIFNNQSYALYFGSGYNEQNSDSERLSGDALSRVEIKSDKGISAVLDENGFLNIYSEKPGSKVTITFGSNSLTFRSVLPEIGIYETNNVSDNDYCDKYFDSRREFFINWSNDNIVSVTVNSISKLNTDLVYDTNNYDLNTNQKSVKITFNPNVDITDGLRIEISVLKKDMQHPDNTYTENRSLSCRHMDSLDIDGIRYYKEIENNVNYYLPIEILDNFNSIKDSIFIDNNNSVIVKLTTLDNNNITRDNVFFNNGAYFKIEKTVSLEAYKISIDSDNKPVLGEKLKFTKSIDLDVRFKNSDINSIAQNTFLFTKNGENYSNSYKLIDQSNSFSEDNQYFWHNYYNDGNSYATIHSTFVGPVVFAKRLNKDDFVGIQFSQQKAEVTTLMDLQEKIDLQFTVKGSKLSLKKLDDPIEFSKDLRITNYYDNGMSFVTSNHYDDSLLIDLKGNTLNLGKHKIIVSEYSTVHIANGTITGSGDSLFDNYGGLSLHNVTCKNTNTSDNSYAIKTYRGTLFLDEKSKIENSKNGIMLTDSHYYSDLDNTCFVSGIVNVNNNGIVFEEKETKFKDTLCVLVPNYINMDIDNQYSILHTITPTVSAGNTAIIASNKTEMMLAGTSYYEKKDDGTYDEHVAKASIFGSISIKSGKLDIDGNIDIVSDTKDVPNIRILSDKVNIGDDLQINIDVSQRTNFITKGNIISESSTMNTPREISLRVYYQQHINQSVFNCEKNDPFVFDANSNVTKNISGGFYSTDKIINHIDKKEYRVIGPISKLYEVKNNSNDPSEYEFEWDYSKDDTYNLDLLEYYLTNSGTRNVIIKSFNDRTSASIKEITITTNKNITIDVRDIIFNLKLIVNANDNEVHINNGAIKNQDDSCIVLVTGELFINSDIITINSENNSSEALNVTGGILHFEANAYAEGFVALNVLATDTMPEVHVCGDLKGTSGTAINYSVNSNLNPDYNEYSLNIVGTDKTKEHSTITGGVVVNNGKVVTMSTEISADIAFELKGNSELVLDNDTKVIGNNTAVFLNGSGNLFFNKGVIEAPYPVKILEGNPQNYHVLFKDGVYCKITSNTNNNVINFVDNNNNIIQNNPNINEYKLNCEFAFFNRPVNENQFNNLNMEMNLGNSQQGMYTCVQYDVLSAEFPYCVAYKLSSVAHNSLHINMTKNDGISVDSTKLDGLKDNQNDNEWTLLVLEEAEIMNKPDNMVDAYEIQVRNVKNDNSVTLISETSDYQMITIPMNPNDIEKIYITHKHGGEETVQLRKITQEEALESPKECYFVNDDSTSISIITKRFSQFGILQNDRDILPFAPEVNTPIAADITYKQKLSDSALTEGWNWEKPDLVPSAGTHTFSVYKTINDSNKYNYSEIEGYDANKNIIVRSVEITVDKAKPKYTVPTGLSATYGDKLSSVTLPDGWTWVNRSLSVGNATTTGNKFEAIFTPSDTKNYHTVPTQLSVIVKKAKTDIESLTIPSFTGVEKGTLLSELKFTESGWNWVNPKDTVSDSNYAVYNPNKNNFTDLLVTVPVYVKETVAGKDVSISNTVKADEKLEDIKVENNNITESVLDIIKNVKSDTVVTGDAKEFISSSGNESLTISTELVKNEVTESAKNEALEKAEVKAENVAMVLDFKINIKVTKGSETKTGTISELAEPVKLTVKLPEGSKTAASEGKELKYYVLVIHGNDVLKIPATLNAADGTVTFEADKFSTYILVSEEVDKPASGNNNSVYVPSGNKKPVVNTAAK